MDSHGFELLMNAARGTSVETSAPLTRLRSARRTPASNARVRKREARRCASRGAALVRPRLYPRPNNGARIDNPSVPSLVSMSWVRTAADVSGPYKAVVGWLMGFEPTTTGIT